MFFSQQNIGGILWTHFRPIMWFFFRKSRFVVTSFSSNDARYRSIDLYCLKPNALCKGSLRQVNVGKQMQILVCETLLM